MFIIYEMITKSRENLTMPFYDLRCLSCGVESNVKASIAEKTECRIPCPKCGSTDMETVFKSAPVYIKSSSDNAPACAGSSSCGNRGCRFSG